MNKNIYQILAPLASAALLGACGGGGSSSPGIAVEVMARAVATPQHDHGQTQTAGTRSFRRDDGMRIDLQTGLIKLVPVELQRCDTHTAWLQRLSPLSGAVAHGGGVLEGGQGTQSVLDAPDTTVELGHLNAQPGRYCALVVELQAGADEASALVDVAPCYYPDTVALTDDAAAAAERHSCIEVQPDGTGQRLSLPLSAPVQLDANQTDAEITVGIRYERWFDGIDMASLAQSDGEQARLVDNVAASLYAVTGAQTPVSVAFKTFVGGEQSACNTVYEGVGNGDQQDFELRDYRFYVSDLHLRGPSGNAPVQLAPKADGTLLQDSANNVALLGHVNGCDGTLETQRFARVLHGSVAQGSYDEICFTLGVPFALNHLDVATAPTPLNVTAMNWNWRGGMKFLRIDGLGDPDGASTAFNLHLGSTGCSNGTSSNGAPPDGECLQANRPQICLDYAEIAAGHSVHVDFAPVLADVDIAQNTEMTPPGCMSGPTDPECLTVLPRLGIDYVHNGNTIAAEPQALFSIGE